MQFRFEDRTLDVDRRELRIGTTTVQVEPQVFDLLVYVIENRNRVVSKDDLVEAVWGGRAISDSTLTTRINAMRKALGDSGEEQRLIRTVSRRGIRFVGEVKENETTAATNSPPISPADTAQERPPLPLPDKPSIAVLPFQNMSGDPEQEYFADGMVEEIITGLSRLHSFFVIARNSSFTYKGRAIDVKLVGRELGVRYLIEGSVRKSANRVRVTAQLIDTRTSAHIWAERYDRDLADVFVIQDEITENVVASIESQLYVAESRRASSKPPSNLDAWDQVMRAQSYLSGVTAEGTRMALGSLEEAIKRDPTYARAHALWSWVTFRLAFMGWGGEIRQVTPSAAAAANKAITLDPEDPWGHFAVGLAAHMQRNPDLAVVSFNAAVGLNPNFALAHAWLGMALAASGRTDEALSQVERALRMSPRDPYKYSYYSYHALAHFAAGRYREAADWAEKSIQERPEYMIGHRGYVAYSALAGDLDRARAGLVVLRRLQPNISLAWVEENQPHPNPLRSRLIEGLRLAGLE